MISHLLLFQNVNIEAKIKNSPNEGYQLGVLIGSYIPFVLLAVIAYWMYHRAKKSKK